MRRLLTAALLVAALVLAGCTSDPSFADDPDYGDQWSSDATAAYYLNGSTTHAVVAVRNATEIELWRDTGIGGDQPLRVDGVRFRHTNGTVVNVTDVDTGSSRTVVTLPAREGHLAYTISDRAGRFSHPMPVAGSALVVLPPGTDARNVALGEIGPGDHEVVADDPLRIRWSELDRGAVVTVRYYDEEDPWLLVALLAVLTAAAIGVLLYYRRIFEVLRRRTRRLEE